MVKSGGGGRVRVDNLSSFVLMGLCAADENRQKRLDAVCCVRTIWISSRNRQQIHANDDGGTKVSAVFFVTTAAVAVGFGSCRRAVGFLGLPSSGNRKKF